MIARLLIRILASQQTAELVRNAFDRSQVGSQGSY